MSHLPASHYLEIYRFRRSMAERGVTHPDPQVFRQVCALVDGLEKLNPTSEIRLDHSGGRVDFIEVSSSQIVGTIDYPETE